MSGQLVADRPFIVGIGGTPREESSTERALAASLRAAEEKGARTYLLGGRFLTSLPHFDPAARVTNEQRELTDVLGRADGVILASPSYHGSISGLLKNALDTLEVLSDAHDPYLDKRAVGCIVTSAGRQAVGTTLMTLRAIVHALRGWPTPYAAALDTTTPMFDVDGAFREPADKRQVEIVADQVLHFASMSRARPYGSVLTLPPMLQLSTQQERE